MLLVFRGLYQEGGGYDVINRLITTATFVVPVLCQDLDYQHHMSWSSLCSMI
jgi:hypothetical protein